MDRGEVTLGEAKQHFMEVNPQYADVLDYFLTRAELMTTDRPKVWRKMKEAKDIGYNIYILSNYGEELFDLHARTKEFINYPDGMVVSYEAKCCKPDKQIYQIMVDRYGLTPSECIFFDDLEENVISAIEFGFSSVQITSEEVLLEELEKLINAGANVRL